MDSTEITMNIRSARDNNDGLDNETLEEANDTGVEIISSISSAHS